MVKPLIFNRGDVVYVDLNPFIGRELQGVVLVNAIHALDLVNRKALKKEVAPDFIVQDCLARIQAVFE